MTDLLRVRVTLSNTVATGGGLMTFHFSEADHSSTTCQAVVDCVRDALLTLTTGYASALAWTVLGTVDVLDLLTGEVTSRVGVSARSGAATGSTTGTPLSSQVMIKWSTGAFTGGRELVGRTFLPASAGGTVTAPPTTAITQANSFASSIIGNAATTFVLFSRAHHFTASVQTGSASSKWAILRSRRD